MSRAGGHARVTAASACRNRSRLGLEAMRVAPLLLVLAASPAAADELEILASRYVRLSADELREAREGHVVARVLDARHPKEVLCVAVLHVSAPKARVLEWLRRPENLEAGDPEQFGRLAEPPELEDLAPLTLDPSQLTMLEKCRAGDCGMKLPAAVITRLRTDVEWARPQAAGRAEAVFREAVLQLALDYWTEGDDGLAVYADRAGPVSVRERLAELLTTTPRLFPAQLELAQGLEARRALSAQAVDSFLAWSKEKLWRRVVIRVAHVLVYEPSPDELQLISKLVFANHFFEAGLSSTVYRSEPGGNSGWLVFVSRLRCDKRGAGFSRLERGLIGMLVKRRLGNQWRAARAELEASADRDAATAPPASGLLPGRRNATSEAAPR